MADTATADRTTADAPGWLEEWLARLDDAGFHVGLRERLLAHALLARAAVAGVLPAAPAEAARLLGPLVCSSPQQQRRYAELLAAWAPAGPVAGADTLARPAAAPVAAGSVLRHWAPLLGLLALLAAVSWWWLATVGRGHDVPTQPTPIASAASVTTSPEPGPQASAPARNAVRDAIYVPPRAMPFEPAAPPAWQQPLRLALGLLGLLSLAALAWAGWRQRRRALFLKGVHSDEEVEEQVLRERAAAGSPVAPPSSMLRPASRLLRQRMAGVREELDVPRTIRATLEAGGAFVPRWRGLAQTPEYLVLIDSRGPADHLVRYQRALVDALLAHNVALTVYEFEVTPEHGCWRVRPGDGTQRFDRSSLAELAGRYAGQRLLVFADPGIALHPTSGAPRDWAAQLKRDFPAAAWFSPRPLASWGAAELQVAEQRDLGFLLLPAHHEALEAVAGWFASERAHLQLPPDLPGPWPAMLGDDALAWAIRGSPPPPEALEHLLFELRQYLGAWRFQWLAACAVFPALSWPLTLGLGAALRDPEGEDERGRALALGIAALGPLPWFRYGHLPAWLREALIERLTPEHGARCRALIEQRLAAALPGADGSELARLALRRAWLQRGKGVARDLVLVDFLQRGERLARLAQRLPETLRRWLFRRGRPGYGLQPAWFALPALFVLIGALAWSPVWQQVLPRDEVMRLAAESTLPGAPNSAGIASVAVSADGLRVLALERLADGRTRLRWMNTRGIHLRPGLDGVPERLSLVVLSVEGQAIGASWNDSFELWLVKDGASVLKSTRTTQQEVEELRSVFADAVALVEGDERVIKLRTSGELVVTRTIGKFEWKTLPVAGVVAVAAVLDSDTLWIVDQQRRLRLWDMERARPLVEVSLRGAAAASALAADPSGAHVAVARTDGTVDVFAGTGELIARLRLPSAVSALAFSPDGSGLLVGDADGTLRWWGAPRGVPLRVSACPADGFLAAPEVARQWDWLFIGGYEVGQVDAVAYSDAAWRKMGQWPDDLSWGEIAFDPADARQAALAREVRTRLADKPTRRSTPWRLREVPDLLAVTVAACASEAGEAVPAPGLAPSAAASAPVVAAQLPLAKLRFEVFQCSPVDADTRTVTTRVQQALRRLGADEVKLSTVGPDVFEKTFRAQDGPYQVRVSRGLADEVAASRVLLADAAFVGAQAWRVVNVAQRSRGYVSVVVCPAAVNPAQTAAPASAPLPPIASAPEATTPTAGRSQRVTVYDLTQFSGSDPPDVNAAAYRLGALGDSWFSVGSLNLARGSNLLAQLSLPQSAAVINASAPTDVLGATINLANGRRLFAVRSLDAVLLSVGLGRMIAMVDAPKQPLVSVTRATRTAADYLDRAALASFEAELQTELRALLAMRTASVNRGIPVVLHTYDYLSPRPAGAGLGLGPWLQPALARRGVPEAEQQAVARQMIDELARMLNTIARDSKQFPNVFVIDTRGTLTPAAPGTSGTDGDWLNEMTPTATGYAKLAARWQGALSPLLIGARTPGAPANLTVK